ncbi:AMP-binding protein [Flavobacterium zepuense]|uniref:AMP-binding protein n=1 Tax=Flavobacterium zepuense TaxID=2593302 RepID=A0A552VAG3_9FLAO|nr:AMP-binding protein [Flavobacterium zepuense]TRW27462.1 AMP-binding protein [Flavobacterium zepuense]
MSNTVTPDFVHPKFKMNGFHFTADDLGRVAYSFIKEGSGYEKSIGDFILDWFDTKDFIEMRTSGTTGTPKIIRVSKQAMVYSALATGDFFEVHEGTKALHCLPTQFVAGKMMLVRALILGWDLDLAEPSSNPLERNDNLYDFCAMVPLQAQHSLDKLNNIKKIILGGAKVNSALSAALQGLQTDVYETYGMTETITHIAAKKIGEEAFTVLPNVAISTDDRHCLIINNLTNEPVVTNDVVEIIDETHFIWLGRYDNVINSGGVKLFPEQIEEKLSHNIKQRFFVAGVTDATLGDKLVLVIEGKPFTLDEAVYAALSKFEKPKAVLFTDAFLETGSGKVQRAAILKSFSL